MAMAHHNAILDLLVSFFAFQFSFTFISSIFELPFLVFGVAFSASCFSGSVVLYSLCLVVVLCLVVMFWCFGWNRIGERLLKLVALYSEFVSPPPLDALTDRFHLNRLLVVVVDSSCCLFLLFCYR